jgi:hypothetical protein
MLLHWNVWELTELFLKRLKAHIKLWKFLLPFNIEILVFFVFCVQTWRLKHTTLKVYLLFCMDVKLDLFDKCNIIGRGCSRTGCWGRYLDLGRVVEIAWGTTWFVLLNVYFYDIGFKENGGTCITHGVGEKCVQNFCCEICRKEILFNTLSWQGR